MIKTTMESLIGQIQGSREVGFICSKSTKIPQQIMRKHFRYICYIFYKICCFNFGYKIPHFFNIKPDNYNEQLINDIFELSRICI